ncbi:MAG: hypothetical protein IPP79_03680 [Chitinophagaceae bacterium]|nr:hypothetical protein [Chitinophagaceae bacterium]
MISLQTYQQSLLALLQMIQWPPSALVFLDFMGNANANSDAASRRTGSAAINDYSLFLAYLGSNTVVSGVYRREDFNMDGSVRRTGSAAVNDYSRNSLQCLSIIYNFTPSILILLNFFVYEIEFYLKASFL